MNEKNTVLLECGGFKNWHYTIKAKKSIYGIGDVEYILTILNVVLNKKIELSKINEEFSREEIKNIIVNYNLFNLSIKNENLL